MNWLDIVILITLATTTIGGVMIGIVRSVATMAGLVVGIVLAGRHYEMVGSWLKFINDTSVANTIGFILIVAAVMVIASIICALLHKLMSAMLLGCLNRLLGGAVGLLIGVLFWSALLALWVKYFSNDVVSNSLAAKFLLDQFPLILALLPSSFDNIRDFFGK